MPNLFEPPHAPAIAPSPACELPDGLSRADAELLNTRLTTCDPEGETERIRIGDDEPPPEIVYSYDVNPGGHGDRDRVWCAHCGGHRHWKGYVVRLGNGSLVNLGHNCGHDQFGFEFGAVENSFNARVDRQASLRRFLRGRKVAPKLRDLAYAVGGGEETRSFDDCRSAFHGAWPVVWRKLKELRSTGGLVSRVMVPDEEGFAREKESVRRHYQRRREEALTRTAREHLRKEMQARLAEVRLASRAVTTNHGALRGTAFLQLQGTLAGEWRALHRRALALCATASTESGGLSDRELQRFSLELSELLDEAERLSSYHEAYRAFWHPTHSMQIVRWWSAHGVEPLIKTVQGGLADASGRSVVAGAVGQAASELSLLGALRDEFEGVSQGPGPSDQKKQGTSLATSMA